MLWLFNGVNVMINREMIKNQQQLLANLGYYAGEIDGIWSTKTIAAKVAFERSGKFNPCIPNQGLPFVTDQRLPEGVYVDAKGLLYAGGNVVKPVTTNKVEEPVVEEVSEKKVVVPATEKIESRSGSDRNEKRRNDNNNQQNTSIKVDGVTIS